MKTELVILIICCIIRNYFIHIKNNVKIPEKTFLVPYEMEPYEIVHLIYLFN